MLPVEDTRPRGEGVGEEEVTGGGICGAVGPAWPLISSTHPCRKSAKAGTWEVSTEPIHHPQSGKNHGLWQHLRGCWWRRCLLGQEGSSPGYHRLEGTWGRPFSSRGFAVTLEVRTLRTPIHTLPSLPQLLDSHSLKS